VVYHEAVCVADPIVALIDMLESVQKVDAVLFVFEYGLFLDSPGDHMIDCSGIFYAEGAGHEPKLSERIVNVNPQDLIIMKEPYRHS